MKLTNNEIYNYAMGLAQFNIDVKIPVRVNFFLQKNAQEIDATRVAIAQQFGELNEEGTAYNIPPEKMAAAQQELNDLFNLVQDANIHVFSLDDFDGIELTTQQLSAIMFMIEE